MGSILTVPVGQGRLRCARELAANPALLQRVIDTEPAPEADQ